MNRIKNNTLLFRGLALTLILGAGVFNFYTLNNMQKTKQEAKEASLSTPKDQFTGFSAGSKIQIYYKDPQNIITEQTATIGAKNLALTVPSNIATADFYQIDYQIENLNKKYIDIALKVHKANNALALKISGLDPKQKISFKVGNEFYDKNLPVDWAGKIHLKKNISQGANNQNICLEINAKKSLCHAIHHHEVAS